MNTAVHEYNLFGNTPRAKQPRSDSDMNVVPGKNEDYGTKEYWCVCSACRVVVPV